MNDFREPTGQVDSLSHFAQEHELNSQSMPGRGKGWPFFKGVSAFFHSFNSERMPIDRSFPLAKLGRAGAQGAEGQGAYMTPQGNAANLVPHEYLPPRRIVRLWNPALRAVPSPFGDASGGVNYYDSPGMLTYMPQPDQKVEVLMKLNIFRPAPIRAIAGQANAQPAAGGSGSNENARIPAVSTLGAF